MGCLTPARARPHGRSRIGDPNVVADLLNLAVRFFIYPRQALKFWIELRPLFQRFRFAQSLRHSMPEIWGAGVGRVNVAMKFRRRISQLDFTNHRNRLAPVIGSFSGQSEDERERARNAGSITLLSNVVKHSGALESNFVYGTQDFVRARLGPDEDAAETGLPHQT